jgi:hypothetical protein
MVSSIATTIGSSESKQETTPFRITRNIACESNLFCEKNRKSADQSENWHPEVEMSPVTVFREKANS